MKRLSPSTVLRSLAFHSSCRVIMLVRAQPGLIYAALPGPGGFRVWNNETGLSITPLFRSPWTHWEGRRGGWQKRQPQGFCPESICHIDRRHRAGGGGGIGGLLAHPKPSLWQQRLSGGGQGWEHIGRAGRELELRRLLVTTSATLVCSNSECSKQP